MADARDNLIDESPYAAPKSQSHHLVCTTSWRTRFRKVLFVVPLLWFACVLLTGMYADNVRYSRTMGSFTIHSIVIGTGAIISISCLVLSLRRCWWHLVLLPLWLFFLTELWILLIQIVVVLLP